MKKFIIGLLAVSSIIGLLSCENAPNSFDPMNGDLSDNNLARRHGGRNTAPCPAEGEFTGFNGTETSEYAVYEYTLWADKDNDVGTVSITNDDENIYVTYTTDETVELDKIHVYIWTSLDDLPNRKPSHGHAAYAEHHVDAFSYTAVIPADTYGDDSYYITAQAKVRCVSDDHGRGHHRMEAYAGDADSPACFEDAGRHWWGYVGYANDSFASISGNVYDDADNSGSFDTGEAGLVGVVVTASGSDGNLYSAITNEAGAYVLEHLYAGVDYTIISADSVGDYVAGENAGGYIISNLETAATQINFGFYIPVTLSNCGVSHTLWANTTTNVGTLSIANDDVNLYITFDTDEWADLEEVHVDIDLSSARHEMGDPATYNANAYVDTLSLPSDAITITIPFADFGFSCSDEMVVKAHAVLTVDGTTAFGGETYRTKGGSYYDTNYYSCCPGSAPQ